VAETAAKEDTVLTVDPKCALLNGDVDLTATLKKASDNTAISGADIDFFIDPSSNPDSIGTATTGAIGVATILSYDLTGISAGDHNLFAAFAGNDLYNESDDSDTLGITYNFVGFQPPINSEGNSIFGNGQVIPVKIKLVDADNNPVTTAKPQVFYAKVNEDNSLGDTIEAASVSAADTGNIMRYVPEDQQYIYNMDLKSFTNGSYKILVDLDDSATCNTGYKEATITVQKKGKK
jgi:hypothetical protein